MSSLQLSGTTYLPFVSRTVSCPFDAIQLQSGESHTWEGIPASVPPDTVYGHYKYTVTFDSPFMPLGLSSITIDPAIDYLPPPASFPIHWPHGGREESEQHRR